MREIWNIPKSGVEISFENRRRRYFTTVLPSRVGMKHDPLREGTDNIGWRLSKKEFRSKHCGLRQRNRRPEKLHNEKLHDWAGSLLTSCTTSFTRRTLTLFSWYLCKNPQIVISQNKGIFILVSDKQSVYVNLMHYTLLFALITSCTCTYVYSVLYG